MRWPRNSTALIVRAGGLKDDEACKLFCAPRVTAVRFGLELSSQPKARRDVKEATSTRTALRKRWVATLEKLGPGYRTKRGAEMPDWVAVVHLPSYKVRRTLHRWSIEVPREIMPNRQRTMHIFHTAAGARVPTPRHHCRLRRQPRRKRRRDQAPRESLTRPLPGTRRSARRRMTEAGARRPQPHRKIGATTLLM